MINDRDYLKYIVQNGNKMNKELKNNIYYCFDEIIRLLLVDYIKDTMDNYDYRNCPDYDGKEDPIIPEGDNDEILIFEDSIFMILSELDEILISESTDIDESSNYIEVEDSDDYISTENDYQRYIFDKLKIEKYLQDLIKDITCLQ